MDNHVQGTAVADTVVVSCLHLIRYPDSKLRQARDIGAGFRPNDRHQRY